MRKIVSIFLFLYAATFFSQEAGEVLIDMQVNPVVSKQYLDLQRNNSNAKLNQQTANVLSLPFKDDFSKDGVYPDTAKWIDKNVFINRTYAKAPISVGVATFDGLNENGYPYNFGAGSTTSGLADYLTSKPINLASPLLPDDSLWFSFYYQAQGLGNAPEPKDSLALEFFDPVANKWIWKWSHKGFIPATNDSSFKLVMIPVKDPVFFQNNFQFRFKNYATLSGNVDHWHIDYVYLDKFRNYKDTIFDDVAFVYNPSSLLKNYQAVPWNHYQSSLLRDSLRVTIRNNKDVTKNTSYNYSLKDKTGIVVHTYNGASTNVDPYITNGYTNYKPFARPPFTYVIPALTDSATYTWENIINTIPDFNNDNDTLRFTQKFYNYFAVDDGTAEVGYGLVGTGTNPSAACKFKFMVKDTLRAVQLFFNPIITNISGAPFRLAVWNDNGGVPGSLIYRDSAVFPIYEQGAHNLFHTYRLKKNDLVLNAGNYFIGWIQSSSDLLNVGLDFNTNNQSNTYVNLSGGWQQSNFKGAIMIRPLVGENYTLASIAKNNSIVNKPFEIFPNPTSDYFTIKMKEEYSVLNISIIDLFGKIVKQISVANNSLIDVSDIANGIYTVTISDTKLYTTQRLVIAR